MRELKARAEGHCEAHLVPELKVAGCYHARHWIGDNGDAHHIVPRSKGRDDRLSNLAYICRDLHMAIDKRKVQWSKKVGFAGYT